MVAGPRPLAPLAANGREDRRYRPSFTNALRGAGANVYVHGLGDPAQIQRFWDLGIGVYSTSRSRPWAAPTPAQLAGADHAGARRIIPA